jgi:hypothetical protein
VSFAGGSNPELMCCLYVFYSFCGDVSRTVEQYARDIRMLEFLGMPTVSQT